MENVTVITPEVQDKINSLGADTIMGDLSNISTEETNKQLEQLQEATAESKAVAASAIGAPSNIQQYLPRKKPTQYREYIKIGRNATCPCGSGKKYKNCCESSGKYNKLSATGTKKNPYDKEAE